MLKQQDIKRCFCFNFIYQIYYMHIKEAIQRRINQQKQPSSSSPLKKSNLIGSIHTGRIDYYPDQPFFSEFKVRKQVKQAKDYVKTFKDGDILQLRQKPWNASVLAPSKFNDFQKEESQRSKLLKIKLGFSDFTPIKYHPNKIYEGVQTRDGFKGWNVSTYFERQQKKQGEQLSTINAIENSIKYNQSNLTNYKSLGKRYNQTVSLQKDQMQKNTKIISDLTQSFMFSYPNASPEKTNASVFKMFDSLKRQKMKNSLMLSQETQYSFTTSFKAKLSPTQKSKIKCVYFHTGAWQKCSQKRNIDTKDDSDIQNMNDKEQDDKCWSCCMNSEKLSKGCSYRIEDGNRMNLQSFNA